MSVFLLTPWVQDVGGEVKFTSKRSRVNVVFLGYVRQINQIDATFKQMFLSAGGFSADQMARTVEEIRDAVQQTMDQVKANLAES